MSGVSRWCSFKSGGSSGVQIGAPTSGGKVSTSVDHFESGINRVISEKGIGASDPLFMFGDNPKELLRNYAALRTGGSLQEPIKMLLNSVNSWLRESYAVLRFTSDRGTISSAMQPITSEAKIDLLRLTMPFTMIDQIVSIPNLKERYKDGSIFVFDEHSGEKQFYKVINIDQLFDLIRGHEIPVNEVAKERVAPYRSREAAVLNPVYMQTSELQKEKNFGG